jgi:hypothetical protein
MACFWGRKARLRVLNHLKKQGFSHDGAFKTFVKCSEVGKFAELIEMIRETSLLQVE